MQTVVLVIHLMIAVSLVGVILVQRSEGGGLGIGGGSGLGGMMTARGTANLLTRTTAILAGAFMLTSIVLAMIASHHERPASIIDSLPASTPAPLNNAPLSNAPPSNAPNAPVDNAPSAPVTPSVPSAPIAQ
ncbi:preprotein translocase subunit SecG [Azospirillaceae bacterium]